LINNLSLVITTYNSSLYLARILKKAIKSKVFKEIIVNDDCSNFLNYLMLKIFSYYFNNDIKIYFNKKNVGGFLNKLNAVKLSSCQYFYLLDSDNYLDLNGYFKLKSLIAKKNTIYIPSILNLVNYRKKFIREVKYNFEPICKKNLNKYLDDELIYWMLNTGNFIANRNFFLKTFTPFFEYQIIAKHEADALAQMYYLLKNDATIEVTNLISHYHTIRDNSYWNTAGEKSILSVEYFKKQLMELI